MTEAAEGAVWEINVRYFPGRGGRADAVRQAVAARLAQFVDPGAEVTAVNLPEKAAGCLLAKKLRRVRQRAYIVAHCRSAHATVYIGPFGEDLYVTSTTYHAKGCALKAVFQHDELDREDIIILSRAVDSALVEGAASAGVDWGEGFSTASRTWCVPGFPRTVHDLAAVMTNRMQAVCARVDDMAIEESFSTTVTKEKGCLLRIGVKKRRIEAQKAAVAVRYGRALMVANLRAFGRDIYTYTELGLVEKKGGCLGKGVQAATSEPTEFERDDAEMLKGAWLYILGDVASQNGSVLEEVESE